MPWEGISRFASKDLRGDQTRYVSLTNSPGGFVTGNLKTNEVLTVLLKALAYYLAARLGLELTLTVSPESIAIFWPPNGILLAVFLVKPYRLWPWIAPGVIAAEIAADLPVFPLGTAVTFGLINLFETGLAAWLIRRNVAGEFNIDRLEQGIHWKRPSRR